jgi:hypothetical protein
MKTGFDQVAKKYSSALTELVDLKVKVASTDRLTMALEDKVISTKEEHTKAEIQLRAELENCKRKLENTSRQLASAYNIDENQKFKDAQLKHSQELDDKKYEIDDLTQQLKESEEGKARSQALLDELRRESRTKIEGYLKEIDT